MQVPPPLEDVPLPDQTALESAPGAEEGTAQPEIEELVIKRPPPANTSTGQEAAVGGIFSSQSPLQGTQGGRGPVSLLLSETIAAEDGESGVEGETGLLREQSKKTFVTELVGTGEHRGERSPLILEVLESHRLEVSEVPPTHSETPLRQEWNSAVPKEMRSPPTMSDSDQAKPSLSKPLLVKIPTEKLAVTSEQFSPLIKEVSEGVTSQAKDCRKPLIEVVNPLADDTPHSSPTLMPDLPQELQNKEGNKTSDVEETLAQPKDSFRPFIEVVEPAKSTPCPPPMIHSQHTSSEEALKGTGRSDDEQLTAWAHTVAGRPLIMEIGENGGKEEMQVEDVEGQGGGLRDLDERRKEGASSCVRVPSLAEKGSEEIGIQESKLTELAETIGSTLNRPPPDAKLYEELKKKWSKHT